MGLPDPVYTSTTYSPTQGYMSLGADQSAFYPPLVSCATLLFVYSPVFCRRSTVPPVFCRSPTFLPVFCIPPPPKHFTLTLV